MGGRVRALAWSEQPRRLQKKRHLPLPEDESSEEDEEFLSETAEDSGVFTPGEDDSLSSDASAPTSAVKKQRHKKPQLAAVTLANYVGKDLHEMFKGLQVVMAKPIASTMDLEISTRDDAGLIPIPSIVSNV
jgi:hypothetical protein